MKYGADARLKEQVGILIGLLGSEYESTRKLSVVDLSLMGAPIVHYLSSALEEKLANPPEDGGSYGWKKERAHNSMIDGVAEALGIIASPSSVPSLTRALPRLSAVEALAKIGTPDARSAIIHSVESWHRWRPGWEHEEEVGGFMRKVAGYLEEKDVTELYRVLTKASLSRTSLDEKRANFKLACEILGELGGPSLIPVLMEDIHLKDEELILAALQAIRKRGATSPVDDLVGLLEVAYKHQRFEGERDTKAKLEGYENHVSKLVSEQLEEAIIELCSTQTLIDFMLSHDLERKWLSDSFLRKAIEWKIANDSSASMPLLLKTLQSGNALGEARAAKMIAVVKMGTGERPKPSSGRAYF
jgi:PBS lyase HEAT-like repeat-containing protein